MGHNLLLLFLGYVTGVCGAWFVLNPTKMFKEGYEAAKNEYSNFEKGFDSGWDCAVHAIAEIAMEWNKHKGQIKETEND